MDYSRVYRSFIEDRRSREGSLEAFDRHHIVPRCIGGGDGPENIIRLSYADHLFAHVLLAKIHGPPLVMPAVRMSGMRKYSGGRRSRERYAHLRAQLRDEMLGNKRKRGKTGMTEEGRRRLSEARRGNTHSKGRVLTEIHKARISASMKRRSGS